MHGVGHKYTTEAFKRCGFARSFPVLEQMEPDPEFPTVKFPNPEEGASALASLHDAGSCYLVETLLSESLSLQC